MPRTSSASAAARPDRTTSQKERLIEATERLLCERGLARVTTRDIAQAAEVAEGAMYHHFNDKAELITAVVLRSVGAFNEVLESLPLQVGQATVQKNLERVVEGAYDLHHRIAPMICSLFADRELLVRVRDIMNERCIGPGRTASVLAAYLGAEQRLGRVAEDADIESAAELMLATSLNRALYAHFYETNPKPSQAHGRLRDTVRALIAGLAPAPQTKRAAGTRTQKRSPKRTQKNGER